jgi:hypothetical protein
MNVKILGEAGHCWAIDGLLMSYREMPDDLWRVDHEQKNIELAKRLAVKDGGHNKFLESVVVWLDIDAPLFWWSQFDTYRCGITKQSESKMHTILKRALTPIDFCVGVYNESIAIINKLIINKEFELAVINMPSGFLQRRIVCTNYKALRTICNQRRGHKLRQWQEFIDALEKGLDWPWALAPDDSVKDKEIEMLKARIAELEGKGEYKRNGEDGQ